jgi:hypothetical protein
MRRRSLVLLGAVVSLLIGLSGGAAFAYFTSSGSGSGVATVGTPSPVTVLDATGTVTNKLYPGGAGDLLVTLDNPNSYAVAITSIVGSGLVTGSGGIGTCTNTGVSVTPGLTGLNISVASGSSVDVVIPGAVSMDSMSDSGCQGATFDVPITLAVHQG